MHTSKNKIPTREETILKPIHLKEIQKVFMKRIEGLESQEKELLLKLYSEITEDIK